MHKKEASILFAALGNEDAVKMLKMLFNKGDMNIEALAKATGTDLNSFNIALTSMLDNELVVENNSIYSVNKELLDTLLKFIVTPCGCVHK